MDVAGFQEAAENVSSLVQQYREMDGAQPAPAQPGGGLEALADPLAGLLPGSGRRRGLRYL